MSTEHRKRTNQKRVKNVAILDFVELNAINFVERTLSTFEKSS